MKHTSTAQNLDWELSPYNYPPMETDACECGSCLCTDCGQDGSGLGEPTVRRLVSKTNKNRVRLPTPMPDAFWLTFYRIKRRLGL